MLTEYIYQQLLRAKYKILDDGSYFGEIPRLKGVWGAGKSLGECQEQLREVLEGWLILKLKDGDKMPGFSAKRKFETHSWSNLVDWFNDRVTIIHHHLNSQHLDPSTRALQR